MAKKKEREKLRGAKTPRVRMKMLNGEKKNRKKKCDFLNYPLGEK